MLGQSRESGWSDLPLIVKVASIVIVLASTIFIVDFAYQRYQKHLAVQQATAMIEDMEAELEAIGKQMQIQVRERQRREARQAELLEARRAEQREARAGSAQGRWMSKNCHDWLRSYRENSLPTAQREMDRHCQAYERYLETGQVAAEFRVPATR